MEMADQESQGSSSNDQVQVRLEKLKKIRARGGNPFRNGIQPTHLAHQLQIEFNKKNKRDLEVLVQTVSIAGRVTAVRDFGKACFLNLSDRSGEIQIYVQKEKLGADKYLIFRDELDVGDFLFVHGTLFKTKTDELTISVSKYDLVTKSLRPLPEKFHGISDIEIKYRQRYLDLMTNRDSRAVFQKRALIVSEIRKFLIDRDFLEVETPMMHLIAGGATARPFKTHHNTLDMELYLRIAPELHLKRLLVGGFERVFEVNRNFRNEGISVKHNPEFTMLEFYQSFATYEDLMLTTRELFQALADRVLGKRKFLYQNVEIDLDGSWKTMGVEEGIINNTKFKSFFDPSQLRDKTSLLEYGKRQGLPMDPKDSVGGLMMVVFDEEVEKLLIQPTFVTHYPLDVSPLSRKNDQDPFLVDRFELFIFGREMANAFSELNDPIDQRERFLKQVEAKMAGSLEACGMDEDFVLALEHGMPPAAGEGIGIDRLVMLFTDSASIRDVILFPLMKPEVQRFGARQPVVL